jgi:hypothetical protein
MTELTVPESTLLRKVVREANYKPVILLVGETDISIPITIFGVRNDCFVINVNLGDDYALCTLAKQMRWKMVSINGRVTGSGVIADAFPDFLWFDIIYVDDKPENTRDNLKWFHHKHVPGMALFKHYKIPAVKSVLDDYMTHTNLRIRGQADSLVAFR